MAKIKAGEAYRKAAEANGSDLVAVRATLVAMTDAQRERLALAAAGHRLANEELEALRLPRMDNVDALEHLARVVEIPEVEIGAQTARSTYAHVLAYVDRERLRARLRTEAEARVVRPVDPPERGHSQTSKTGRQSLDARLVAKMCDLMSQERDGKRGPISKMDVLRALEMKPSQRTQLSDRDQCPQFCRLFSQHKAKMVPSNRGRRESHEKTDEDA